MPDPDAYDFPCSRTFRNLHSSPHDSAPPPLYPVIHPSVDAEDRRTMADLVHGLVEQVRDLKRDVQAQHEVIKALSQWKDSMVKRMAERRQSAPAQADG